MAWTQHTPPHNNRYTTYISMYRNGDMYAILSLDHGINNNSMAKGLEDKYSVQTRTHYKSDTFIQLQEAKKGTLKITTRNFKTLDAAKRYLYNWMKSNP